MFCPNCKRAVSDPYEHVNTYGPSYTCKAPTVKGLIQAKRAAKKPAYSYTYDHRTGLYSMDAASLIMWLMDVEGRAKLEKALAKLTSVPFDLEGVVV